MPAEAPLEHPQAVFLVGDMPESLRARLQPAEAPGWHLTRAADVYAAAAILLRAVQMPAAVLVVIEGLRGDELRFFDFLARRFPSLPVAAIWTIADQDRRLDACRRRGIATLQASNVTDWLSQFRIPTVSPAVPPAPAAQERPVPPAAVAAPADRPVPTASMPTVLPPEDDSPPNYEHQDDQPQQEAVRADPPAQTDARSNLASLSIEQMPDESFVDLPDELVSQLPDELDDLPEEAPVYGDELTEAALEDELPPLDDDEYEENLPEPDDADSAADDVEQLPLTP